METKDRKQIIHELILNEMKKAKEKLKFICKKIEDGDDSEENLNQRDRLNNLLDGLARLDQDAERMDTDIHTEYQLIQTDEKDCHMAVYIDPDTGEAQFCVVSDKIEDTLEALKDELEKKAAEKKEDNSS